MDERYLEKYIEDWYWDEKSHKIAVEIGKYMLGFVEYLKNLPISDQVKNRHIRKAWFLGYIECVYGYHDKFSPEIFLFSGLNTVEFRHKVGKSKYMLESYKATWRKLKKYVQES